MDNAAIFVTPFHIGWKVQFETPTRQRREAVTGRREVAIELATYYARQASARDVVICREDGSVEQRIAAAL